LFPYNLNPEAITEGWWYQKYAPEHLILAALEAAARVARRGLWIAPNLYHRGNGGIGQEVERKSPLVSSFDAVFLTIVLGLSIRARYAYPPLLALFSNAT